ncbi:anthranilate phosphoribosyltransferase, partial [Candidatus Peregrinibacteria bacterium]|nr:anthranilate phosphoribosyltransferase [Candidatus Peregrinibacteria bacterium]
MKEILEKLLLNQNLTRIEVWDTFSKIMKGDMSESQIAGFLIALRAKGVSAEEISVSAEIMRDSAKKVCINSNEAMDTCGTGGAKVKTFNVSTATAFVLAAAGVTVAKHGNRSNTSASGSSDVLRALGVNIEMTQEETEKKINEGGIGFLFAPLYHPAMKYVVPVRKDLEVRTIFNLLGPLINPAAVKYQIIGVFEECLINTFAFALQELGHKRAIVVYGEGGLDEFSLIGPSKYALLEDGNITLNTLEVEDVGLSKASLSDLVGGGPKENAEIIENILKGKDTGPKSDLVALNAGAGLFVANKASSIKEGVGIAKEILVSGKALE